MKKQMQNKILFVLFIVLTLYACKKESAINPYEGIIPVENNNPNIDEIPSNNFAWIHAKILAPTCANSGCHDGSFEPHFNTISSAYNTIVNHEVISNDANNNFTYRVTPDDAESSLMYARMITSFPNTSGLMPAVVDPDSDWAQNSTSYLSKIETWINDGAKDMYGNPAPTTSTDFPPQVTGLVIFPQGNTTDPYSRDVDEIGITPILVEAAEIDIWIYITDDNTNPSTMNNSYLKSSQDITNFDSIPTNNFSVNSPLLALDFFDAPVNFLHKTTINLSEYESGETFFLRNYLDDGIQTTISELPNAGSNAVITSYFVIKIQ